jgi:peptide/nickel transport system permease protein
LKGSHKTLGQRFRRSRLAVGAVVYVALITLIAAAAPLLTAYDPNEVDIPNRLQAPSAAHPFGTDEVGRDVLTRMTHGARVSLIVGFSATLISLLAGTFLGAIAGYYGGLADWIVSRLIDVVLCFPFLFLVLGIVAFFRPSFYTILIALALTSWTTEARFVRAEFLRIRELEYAQAARAGGARDPRIIFRHLLPNALGPVLVSASFGVASAIMTESALSFLGYGVALPTASWGRVLAAAQQYIEFAWWLALFPGLAIFLTVAAFNLIGDRIRDVLDPM